MYTRRAETTDEDDTNVSSHPGNEKMWAVSGENFFPCEKAVDELKPGHYVINESSSQGIFFTNKKVDLDDLIVFPDMEMKGIINQIESFWDKKSAYDDFGFLWKRGILMWGEPGTGKTSTINLLSEMVIKRGGISVFVSDPGRASRGLELFRRIEPDRPILVILEDLDAIVKYSNNNETELLALLDGELQIKNVVFVATTNYPEQLDKRLVNRPSRFDYIVKVGQPGRSSRKMFLEHKFPQIIGTKVRIINSMEDPADIKLKAELESQLGDLRDERVLSKDESVGDINKKISDLEIKLGEVTDRVNSVTQTIEDQSQIEILTKAAAIAKTAENDGEVLRIEKEISILNERIDSNKKEVDALEAWVDMTKGFSLSYIKEMVLLVGCYDKTLDEAASHLRKMQKTNFKKGGDLGF